MTQRLSDIKNVVGHTIEVGKGELLAITEIGDMLGLNEMLDPSYVLYPVKFADGTFDVAAFAELEDGLETYSSGRSANAEDQELSNTIVAEAIKNARAMPTLELSGKYVLIRFTQKDGNRCTVSMHLGDETLPDAITYDGFSPA